MAAVRNSEAKYDVRGFTSTVSYFHFHLPSGDVASFAWASFPLTLFIGSDKTSK